MATTQEGATAKPQPGSGKCPAGFTSRKPEYINADVCVKLPPVCKVDPEMGPGYIKCADAFGNIVETSGTLDACVKKKKEFAASFKSKLNLDGKTSPSEGHWYLFNEGETTLRLEACIKVKDQIVDCMVKTSGNDQKKWEDVLAICKTAVVP